MAFERSKRAAAAAAVDCIEDGHRVGLGTGSTSLEMLRLLAERVAAGLKVVGVPTSDGIAEQARALGVPLLEGYPDFSELDIALDGADEADPRGRLIKGGGAALLREKLVAAASRKFVVMVDESKLVEKLGQGWALPVEVVPFGWTQTRLGIEALGGEVHLRKSGDQPLRTDQGNFVMDCRWRPIADPEKLQLQLLRLPGVVETGLFLGMTTTLVVGAEDGSSRVVQFVP